MTDFHERLKTLRVQSGKNQIDLAELLDVKRATISAYETNKIIPPYDKIKLLADFFNVSVDYLMEGKTEEENKLDVSNTLRLLLNQLTNEKAELVIDGVTMDEVSKELLVNSIESSLKMGKLLAKSKK